MVGQPLTPRANSIPALGESLVVAGCTPENHSLFTTMINLKHEMGKSCQMQIYLSHISLINKQCIFLQSFLTYQYTNSSQNSSCISYNWKIKIVIMLAEFRASVSYIGPAYRLFPADVSYFQIQVLVLCQQEMLPQAMLFLYYTEKSPFLATSNGWGLYYELSRSASALHSRSVKYIPVVI